MTPKACGVGLRPLSAPLLPLPECTTAPNTFIRKGQQWVGTAVSFSGFIREPARRRRWINTSMCPRWDPDTQPQTLPLLKARGRSSQPRWPWPCAPQ